MLRRMFSAYRDEQHPQEEVPVQLLSIAAILMQGKNHPLTLFKQGIRLVHLISVMSMVACHGNHMIMMANQS